MRKVYVEVKARLIVQVSDDEEIGNVLSNMDYDFIASDDDNAEIIDTDILDWEVTDSK